jgi:hypothetical protein
MVLDKALERLDSWRMRPINELTSDEIISRFQELASKTRTAAEQTFRWAIAATNSAIIAEGSNALAQRRGATLSYNPFRILKEKRMFRDRKKLEKDYQASVRSERRKKRLASVGETETSSCKLAIELRVAT